MQTTDAYKWMYRTGSSSSDFDKNDPIYLSLGGLLIFSANGGTLSELELRVLYHPYPAAIIHLPVYLYQYQAKLKPEKYFNTDNQIKH